MPSIVFVLDCSGSMSTKSHPKFSFFDYAKNYIESFIKSRSRNDRDGRQILRENDRYFFLTTQCQYPENVKVLAEKNPGLVLDEVKKIALPYGANVLHPAILDAFRVLHVNRAQTGIDGYGVGRAPQNTEQVLVVVLTDGNGVAQIPGDYKLHFDPPFLGSEMTREAFRWDQKLFTVVFRIPSTPYRPSNHQLLQIDIDMPVIERLCSRTGGRSFSIVSVRQLQTSIDHILSSLQLHRIGVRFDLLPQIPGRIPQEEFQRLNQRYRKILEKRPVTNLISRLNPQGRPVTCHWPIPEGYFPVRNMDTLKPRSAHPMILLAPEPLPLVIRNDVPYDKLELEAGGVTDILMEMLQEKKDHTVWAFIDGASHGPTAPFGCLRMNALGNGVVLVLLPYNFPVFYQFIEELVKEPVLAGSQSYKQKLEQYFQTVPFYYYSQMRVCMEKFKVRPEISGSMSGMYAATLLSTLNRLKIKAKEEWDQVGIASKLNEAKHPRQMAPMIRIERITTRSSIIGLGGEDDSFEEEDLDGVEPTAIYSGEYTALQIPLYPPTVKDPDSNLVYKTPYTSSIEDMVSKLNRIQANVELLFDPQRVTLLDMAKLGTKARFNTLEELHNMPLKSMGDYEQYQAARVKHYGAPFKKIEEDKEKTHAFGNPYKLKGLGAGVDEVMDSAVVDSSSKNEGRRFGSGEFGRQQGGGPPKRRRGPLGIDAFDKWRTRRSMRGSSAASDLSEDIRSLSDFTDEELMDTGTPGPSSSGSSTPVPEMERMHVEEMDSDAKLFENFDAVNRMRWKEVHEKKKKREKRLETISASEMTSRRLRIGTIVRKPANRRAYEEIVELATGITSDASESLIKYAVRESQRFKLKKLTERLQKRLGTV